MAILMFVTGLMSHKIFGNIFLEFVLVLIAYRNIYLPVKDNPIPFDHGYLCQVYDIGSVNPHKPISWELLLHLFHAYQRHDWFGTGEMNFDIFIHRLNVIDILEIYPYDPVV